MELGQRLKEIRRSKGISLQQVGDGANLSKSFVSQVESGTANPSIASLKRIADVLGIPLAALLEDHNNGEASTPQQEPVELDTRGPLNEIKVVRHDRRKMLVWPGSSAKTYLLTPDLQRKLEVILDVEEPRHNSGHEWYSHIGEEFGLVLEGRYEVTIRDEVFVLEEGDSIYFPSHLPHKTRVLGDRPAKTLWVVTPPSF